jgi:GT2 family glycosyltransferase
VLVRLDRNVGFAKANNIGADILPADAYLLVNDDAFVHRRGTVAALVESARRTDVGVVVPRLLNPDLTLQPNAVAFTTNLTALVRASGLSRLLPDRWQPHLSTHWSHDRSREIEAANGAVMLVRGSVWERLGGLREDTFMYAEDIDLCWRARQDGWMTWFCADAEFVHLGSTASGLRWGSRERWARIGQAEASMIRRQLPPARAALALASMRAGAAARVVVFSLLRKRVRAASYRGFLEGLSRTAPKPETETAGPRIEILRPRSG